MDKLWSEMSFCRGQRHEGYIAFRLCKEWLMMRNCGRIYTEILESVISTYRKQACAVYRSLGANGAPALTACFLGSSTFPLHSPNLGF